MTGRIESGRTRLIASLRRMFAGKKGATASPSRRPRGFVAAPASTPAGGSAPAPSKPHYAAEADGEPDPGEVVWAWVPYEDDPSQGKDRPVLVIATDGDGWVGLMLSSKDHDLDAEQEARYGRYWMDVGTGAWDSQRRPSEVRLDRLIPLSRDTVRREGAALDEALFRAVVDAARGLPR